LLSSPRLGPFVMGGDKRSAGGGSGNYHKKQKYMQKGNSAKNNDGGIPRGGKGIFVTCDGGKERTAGQEVVSILNEYWEKLHPSEEPAGGAASEDVTSALQAELEELKQPSAQRFFWMQLKIHGVIFVKMRQAEGEMGPVELIQHIMEDLLKTKQLKSRFCIRLIPVEGSCPAKLPAIKSFTKEMCAAAFPADKPQKFAVSYEARATAGEPLKRMEVIDTIVENIGMPPHTVDLTNPDKTVLVEVVKGTCAVSIVSTYQKHLKFNIRSLTAPEEKGKDAATGEGKAAKGGTAVKTQPEAAVKAEEKPVGAEGRGGAGCIIL